MAGMRSDECLSRSGRREHDALGHAPRTLQPIEEVLERHAVEPDMVRADPQIDRTDDRRCCGRPTTDIRSRACVVLQRRVDGSAAWDPRDHVARTKGSRRQASAARTPARPAPRRSMPDDPTAARTRSASVRGRSTSGRRLVSLYASTIARCTCARRSEAGAELPPGARYGSTASSVPSAANRRTTRSTNAIRRRSVTGRRHSRQKCASGSFARNA